MATLHSRIVNAMTPKVLPTLKYIDDTLPDMVQSFGQGLYSTRLEFIQAAGTFPTLVLNGTISYSTFFWTANVTLLDSTKNFTSTDSFSALQENIAHIFDGFLPLN